MPYYPFILAGLVAIGLIVRALGASASRATAAAAAPAADQIGGANISSWRASFAKSLATKGASISPISDPLAALSATREATFQRDIVLLVEHDVFDAHADGLEDQLVKLARNGRPQTLRNKGQCAVCLVVGGPGAVDALPKARLRQGMGWYVVVTAFDTTTNRAADMPSSVQTGKVLSVPTLAGMQEAVTALALAGGNSSTELKTCPECAERVRVAARKCRFCGFQFAEPPKRAGSEPEAVDSTYEGDTGPPTADAVATAVQPPAQSLEQGHSERGRSSDESTATTTPAAPSTFKTVAAAALIVGVLTTLIIWLAPGSRPPASSASTTSAGAVEAAPTPVDKPPATRHQVGVAGDRRWSPELRGSFMRKCRDDGPSARQCSCLLRAYQDRYSEEQWRRESENPAEIDQSLRFATKAAARCVGQGSD